MKRMNKLNRTFQNREKIILRDFLAMQRTTLANERTLFSYLKAGVYFILAGFAFLKIDQFKDLYWLSYGLFVASLGMIIFGTIRYYMLKRKLEVYYNAMEQEDIAQIKKDISKESES